MLIGKLSVSSFSRSLHLLVPQIEHAMRELLVSLDDAAIRTALARRFNHCGAFSNRGKAIHDKPRHGESAVVAKSNVCAAQQMAGNRDHKEPSSSAAKDRLDCAAPGERTAFASACLP
jgi:hypothetical protein